MRIPKIFTVLCFLALSAQTISAQQNMWVADSVGMVNAVEISSTDHATFNADNNWFNITNKGVDAKTSTALTASCTVALNTSGMVKKLSTTPEIGVCYSLENNMPTINDDCLTLGSALRSYSFTLSPLIPGTTYYYRVYIKLADEAFYSDTIQVTTSGTKPTDNSKTLHGHKFVDLGLPSGMLWAETNIGAETAADDGNYYAWGETTTKPSYSQSNYKYYDSSSNTYTKYNTSDGKTILDKEDDAAWVNWGEYCRLPTSAELTELRNSENCKWRWTSSITSSGSSIYGYKVTSKRNGNSIFFPASGYISGTNSDRKGIYGYCWTGTLYTYGVDYAYCLFTGSSFYGTSSYSRYLGHTVRPVAEP